MKLALAGTFPLIAAAFAACGGEGDEAASDRRAQVNPRAAAVEGAAAVEPAAAARRTRRALRKRRRPAMPSIEIVRPKSGATIRGGQVRASVSIDNFDVVEQRVRPPFPGPVEGKGHIHFYLDTMRLPTEHGPPATGAYRSVTTPSYTWTGLAPGRHSLAVQLVGKDHVPLRPPARDSLSVVVK